MVGSQRELGGRDGTGPLWEQTQSMAGGSELCPVGLESECAPVLLGHLNPVSVLKQGAGK